MGPLTPILKVFGRPGQVPNNGETFRRNLIFGDSFGGPGVFPILGTTSMFGVPRYSWV